MTPEKLYDALSKLAASRNVELNNDREFVMDILQGLLRNEERHGYRCCPCRLPSGSRQKDADIICPCRYSKDDIDQYGSCYCGLYVTREWNEKKIKRQVVPERRPVDLS